MKKILLLSLLLNTSLVCAQEHQVTYIANEGIMIEASGKKVLIDALFDAYYDQYLSPDAPTRQAMIEGESPYANIDLALVTHMHRDHFEAKVTEQFLQQQRKSRLLSSEQVKNEIRKVSGSFSTIENRIVSRTRDTYTVESSIKGIKVFSFFINHAGGDRQIGIVNMGFVVEIDGKRVLHLGDSEMDFRRFQEVDLKQYEIDLALVPYWYLSDQQGKRIVNETIAAKKVVGIHFPKAPSKMAISEIADQFPEAHVFQKVGESVSY